MFVDRLPSGIALSDDDDEDEDDENDEDDEDARYLKSGRSGWMDIDKVLRVPPRIRRMPIYRHRRPVIAYRSLVIEYVFTLVVRFFRARNLHRRKNHARR